MQQPYRRHLAGLTVPIHSPLFARRGREAVWITPQQYRLLAAVFAGWRGQQRALATSTGYSLAGLNDALSSMAGLGILGRLSRRGRLGWTLVRLQRGVHALANVSRNVRRRRWSTSETDGQLPLSPSPQSPNISPEPSSADPPGPGLEAWRALRETLFPRG